MTIKKVWRNDRAGKERFELPTVSTVVITATDEITTKEIYTLHIRHVIKDVYMGFMYSITAGSSLVHNGYVYFGSNEDLYAVVRKRGETKLDQLVEQLKVK